jgi:glycosyltransferase involved in cell wall biosynthesis
VKPAESVDRRAPGPSRQSLLDDITPLVITFDEIANIRRTLGTRSWARRLVVVDSGSTDGTREAVAEFPNAELITRPFDDFASQCNFGLSQIGTDWALSIDADYELSDELIEEMRRLTPDEKVSGYRARFVYRIYGRSLRGTLYPSRAMLYRPERATYFNKGHGHRVQISGEVLELDGVVYHDDRKSLARWFSSQQKYARQEATYLIEADPASLRKRDRLRKYGWPAPIAVFFYTLILKGCILDGPAGWLYVLQRVIAECMLAAELTDRRLRKDLPTEPTGKGAV